MVPLYDPSCSQFSQIIREEIEVLRNKNSWDIVSSYYVQTSTNALRGRFLLPIKDKITQNEVSKAQLAVQGHQTSMKSSIVHNNADSRPFSTKMIIRLAFIK